MEFPGSIIFIEWGSGSGLFADCEADHGDRHKIYLKNNFGIPLPSVYVRPPRPVPCSLCLHANCDYFLRFQSHGLTPGAPDSGWILNSYLDPDPNHGWRIWQTWYCCCLHCRPHWGGDARVLSARQHGSRARASGSGAPTIIPHHTDQPSLFKDADLCGQNINLWETIIGMGSKLHRFFFIALNAIFFE